VAGRRQALHTPASKESPLQFKLEQLEQWTPERTMPVSAEAIAAYARATNDDSPAAADGRTAPPVFSIVPVWDVLQEAAVAIAPDEESRKTVVHGDQDIFIKAPIEAGMTVRARAAAVGVHVKGSGTTVVLKTETRAEDDRLLNEQYVTEFYRGVTGGDGGGGQAPDHRLPEAAAEASPEREITYEVDEDQTYRYKEASGDDHAIHVDPGAARAAGLPGIIVHGLCMMAMAGRAVLEAEDSDDPAAIRRLAVRFSRPMAPGDELTTRIRPLGTDGAVGFDAVDGAGEVVLKDGLAELRS
jgi:acyl dehydratase